MSKIIVNGEFEVKPLTLFSIESSILSKESIDSSDSVTEEESTTTDIPSQ